MTYWKCPSCAWIKNTKENIKITFCRCCMTEMKLEPYNFNKITEVKNGRGESEPVEKINEVENGKQN